MIKHLGYTCQYLTTSVFFWILVFGAIVAEPVLCSHFPSVHLHVSQRAVLFISSGLLLIQFFSCASNQWDHVAKKMEDNGERGRLKFMWRVYKAVTIDREEIMMELFLIIFGWLLINTHPGIAALRCFRVFRLLWFYREPAVVHTVQKLMEPIFGSGGGNSFLNVMKFAVLSINSLGTELFTISKNTRGGLLLMILFFYSAFVFGISLWVATDESYAHCTNRGECIYTMIRLAFFDGNGLDFAYSLVHLDPVLFIVVMFYMCMTAFGIINGLVGIFGTLFMRASDSAFEEGWVEYNPDDVDNPHNNDPRFAEHYDEIHQQGTGVDDGSGEVGGKASSVAVEVPDSCGEGKVHVQADHNDQHLHNYNNKSALDMGLFNVRRGVVRGHSQPKLQHKASFLAFSSPATVHPVDAHLEGSDGRVTPTTAGGGGGGADGTHNTTTAMQNLRHTLMVPPPSVAPALLSRGVSSAGGVFSGGASNRNEGQIQPQQQQQQRAAARQRAHAEAHNIQIAQLFMDESIARLDRLEGQMQRMAEKQEALQELLIRVVGQSS